ncbi:MAG: ABC transporter substrate-binding protein, partial [Actinomycetota bacterium]
WLTNGVEGTVWRVDPTSGKTLKEIAVGPGLRGIAVTDTAAWVTSETAGSVTQIDMASNGILRVVQVGNGPGAVAIGEGSVWVANVHDGTVSRIDQATGKVTGTIRAGRGPRAIAIARGRVFVANEESESVTMIDARSGSRVRDIGLDNAPMGLVADGERVWVSVRGGIARYRGGTLRIGTSAYVMNSFDPAFGNEATNYSVAPVLYDGLTAFKRVGGPEGNQLLPDLVEELRRPTDNGTTYSYTLRAGLKYSDGSPVKASDVRSTFERLIRNEQYGGTFLNAVKGRDACTPARCDLSEGIVTNDEARTISFHLLRSYPEFPYILALPSLSIVPATAPAKDGGSTPIPGTGPYRIAAGELELDPDGFGISGTLRLERNPHFRSRGLVQPDAYADQIEITMGGDLEKHIDDVKAGRIDFTLDLLVPTLAERTAELASEFPSQIHVADFPSTLFLMLSPNVPPFNDERARRALNFAIDRKAMIGNQSLTLELSCQLLPENMIGFSPYCPYTTDPSESGLWTGPDMATARRLVEESGTKGQSVTVWLMEGDSPSAEARRRIAPMIVEALRRIGYRASAREIPGDLPGYFEAIEEKNSRRQILLSGWITDYPGPANFFLPLTTCLQTLVELAQEDLAFTRYCSPKVDELTLQALELQEEDPAAAAKLWTQVDRAITDASPLVTWANLRNPFFVSERVGNVQGHIAYLVLLSQMWVVDNPAPTPS